MQDSASEKFKDVIKAITLPQHDVGNGLGLIMVIVYRPDYSNGLGMIIVVVEA